MYGDEHSGSTHFCFIIFRFIFWYWFFIKYDFADDVDDGDIKSICFVIVD